MEKNNIEKNNEEYLYLKKVLKYLTKKNQNKKLTKSKISTKILTKESLLSNFDEVF